MHCALSGTGTVVTFESHSFNGFAAVVESNGGHDLVYLPTASGLLRHTFSPHTARHRTLSLDGQFLSGVSGT